MQLKSSQVEWIEKDLATRGVTYGPLQEDLLDHLCNAVEARMAKGMIFIEAYELSILELEPTGLNTIQDQTFRTLNPTTLIRNYFIVAFRSLLKQKWHSAFNLLGLTVGLASCLMIFLFIRYEASYDTQHPVENLYRLVTDIKRPSGETSHTAMSGAPWGPQMVAEFPEILDKARFMKYRLDVPVTYKAEDKHFMEPNLIWADQEALQFFHLPLVLGDQNSALEAPNSVVISQAMAAKYFGNDDPLGKVLTYNDEVDLVVTGVMQNMPENMHFKADIIGSFSSLDGFWSIIDDWSIIYYYTYFELSEGANPDALKAGFPAFFEKHLGPDWSQYRSNDLQKVSEIYLNSQRSSELKVNSDSAYLYLLAAIALIILLLACANFINLNIARSLQRVREVGIRKVMGSSKTDLFVQFVSESFVLVLLASILALFTASLALPYFNQLLGKSLDIWSSFDWVLLGYVLLILLIVSLLSAIFPAMVAVRLSTVLAMKGRVSKRIGGFTIKNALLLFQFAIGAILIIAIGTIKMQQDYIASKDLGYEKDQLLMISMSDMEEAQMKLIKESLLSLPAIEGVSFTSHKLAGDQSYHASYAFSEAGKSADTLNLGRLHIDKDFIQTYQLNLLAGRDYRTEMATDTASFLINETVVRRLGLPSNEAAIGMTIDYMTQGVEVRYPRSGRVIGVVNDFHFETLHHNVEGFVMDIQPARYHFYACRVNGADSQAAVADVEAKLKEVIPGRLPEHFWLTDQLNLLYQTEFVFGRLISIASAIAIALALFGLLSLVLQLVSTRRKEVGVRKVLGAGAYGIVWLFMSKFGRVLGISFLLAWPLAYLWMSQWLSQFPYRIDMPWTLYLFSAFILTFLALACIAFSTLNVARMNPAKSLRYD